MTDQTWSLVLSACLPVVSVGVLALLGWWVKNQAGKTWLQKALQQLALMLQGFASDVTSGMTQAVQEAAADGQITPAERAALVDKLVQLVKQSATGRFLSQLESALGLATGSAFDTWLRGMAGEHIDAQIATSLPAQAKMGAATAALATAALVGSGAPTMIGAKASASPPSATATSRP